MKELNNESCLTLWAGCFESLFVHRGYFNYTGTDWVHYTIPVGTFFTGFMNYLMFINDDDAADAGIGKFSNIQIYEDN